MPGLQHVVPRLGTLLTVYFPLLPFPVSGFQFGGHFPQRKYPLGHSQPTNSFVLDSIIVRFLLTLFCGEIAVVDMYYGEGVHKTSLET